MTCPAGPICVSGSLYLIVSTHRPFCDSLHILTARLPSETFVDLGYHLKAVRNLLWASAEDMIRLSEELCGR